MVFNLLHASSMGRRVYLALTDFLDVRDWLVCYCRRGPPQSSWYAILSVKLPVVLEAGAAQ